MSSPDWLTCLPMAGRNMVLPAFGRSRVRRRRKLQPRVDLPHYEPWGMIDSRRDTETTIEDRRSAAVVLMRERRAWPRRLDQNNLVPESVRVEYAARWRDDLEALEHEEAHRLAEAEARRLVNRIKRWCKALFVDLPQPRRQPAIRLR